MFDTEEADWLFIIVASTIWGIALFLTIWDFIQLQEMRYQFGLISGLGLLLFIVGVTIRIIARKTLGEWFTHGLRVINKHNLVTTGIYKHVRHPDYTGSLLLSYGIPLIFNSSFGIVAMFPIIGCILYRIQIEEKMLIETLADQYLEYIENSNKLIPFIY